MSSYLFISSNLVGLFQATLIYYTKKTTEIIRHITTSLL